MTNKQIKNQTDNHINDSKATDAVPAQDQLTSANHATSPATSPPTMSVPADWHEQLAAKDEAYRRALADYQNLQRRSAQEKTQLMAAAAQVVLADLLPTLDHLELAGQHISDPSLPMIVADFRRALEHHGLEKIATVGQTFDPNLMEAVDVRTDAHQAENTVVEEQRPGYKCRGQLLRPAQVVVSQKAA